MSKLLSPANYGIETSVVLKSVTGKPHKCHECSELVTEFLWSPFFCPDHDILRIARISNQLKSVSQQYGIGDDNEQR